MNEDFNGLIKILVESRYKRSPKEQFIAINEGIKKYNSVIKDQFGEFAIYLKSIDSDMNMFRAYKIINQ